MYPREMPKPLLPGGQSGTEFLIVCRRKTSGNLRRAVVVTTNLFPGEMPGKQTTRWCRKRLPAQSAVILKGRIAGVWLTSSETPRSGPLPEHPSTLAPRRFPPKTGTGWFFEAVHTRAIQTIYRYPFPQPTETGSSPPCGIRLSDFAWCAQASSPRLALTFKLLSLEKGKLKGCRYKQRALAN